MKLSSPMREALLLLHAHTDQVRLWLEQRTVSRARRAWVNWDADRRDDPWSDRYSVDAADGPWKEVPGTRIFIGPAPGVFWPGTIHGSQRNALSRRGLLESVKMTVNGVGLTGIRLTAEGALVAQRLAALRRLGHGPAHEQHLIEIPRIQ